MADKLTTRRLLPLAFSLAILFLSTEATPAADSFPASDSAFRVEPTWKPIAAEVVHAQLQEYLSTAAVAPERHAAVREAWAKTAGEPASAGGNEAVLDRLAASLAKADDRVQELVDFCAAVSHQSILPEFAWLADSETPRLVRNNMRLYLARWLVQEGYHDEALAWTEGLETTDVVAPEALLFYRAVAYHRLVQPDKADAALSLLLQRQEELPTRYQKLAALMQQDLSGLEDESLDHIARRMDDVRRRLEKGRSGERVQQVENGVIESLDKLIKKIEDQLQQQQQAMAGSSGGQQSSAPMQDSQLPGGQKAPGKVNPRDVGDESGWGNMNEKDREKALQDIGREFPSHYREVIQEYFRRLAAEESAEEE